MNRRQLLGLLGTGTIAGSFALGSTGTSSIEADRGTSVTVVGDEDAYLALEFSDAAVDCSGTIPVSIANRATQALDSLEASFSLTGGGTVVDVEATASPPSTSFETAGTTLSLTDGEVGVGESVDVGVRVGSFSGAGTGTLSFDVVTAGGEGTDTLSIETTESRELAVSYSCGPSACPVAPSVSVSPDTTVTVSDPDVTKIVQSSGVTVDGKSVEERVESTGGSVTVKSSSTIGGDVEAAGAVPSVTDAAIGGSVTADGDISDDGGIDGATIAGDVETTDPDDGKITIRDGTKVGGSVDAAGGIEKIVDSDIGGSVTAADAIQTIKNAGIGGTIEADGKVSDGEGIKSASIAGDVVTTDDDNGGVRITNESTIAGSVDAAGPISALKDSTVGGSVTAGGDISDDGGIRNSHVGGSVATTDADDGKIVLKSATICGPVTAAGSIEQISDSEIGGSVDADGAVPTIEDTRIFGGVTAGGKISGGEGIDGATIDGNVVTTDADAGKVTIKDGSTIGGSVEAAGAIPKIKNATVEGDVQAAGDIAGNGGIDDATVAGSVTTTDGGAVSIKGSSAEVGTGGTAVDADGDVTVSGGATVAGSVVAEGAITVNGATVEGNAEGASVTVQNGGTVEGTITEN